MSDELDLEFLRDVITRYGPLDESTVLALIDRTEAAERAVQRVREVCDSEAYEVSNEHGSYDAVAVENILDALDGDTRD